MNMPLDVRKILHKLAWDKQNSEDKKDQEEIQADAVQGVLEEGGLMQDARYDCIYSLY